MTTAIHAEAKRLEFGAGLSRRQLFAKALAWRDAGCLYDLSDTSLTQAFDGSVDRFVEVCFRLASCRRILDVGAGPGLLVSLLHELGHDCCGVDLGAPEHIYQRKNIPFQTCNVEIEPLPYASDSFDAVVCGQVLEHFTHSHLPVLREMRRVLRGAGVVEVDVPNVACFRNVSRLLRGKNITWDYAQHYLHAEPILSGGRSFYPHRHNREFTRNELELLLRTAGFSQVKVFHFKDRNYRMGFQRLRSLGSAIRDWVPRFRKSLIGFGVKAAAGFP